MEADRALSRLGEYQRRIAHIIVAARDALAGDSASGQKTVAGARWELVRILREYQLFKHTEIFDPLIAYGDSVRATNASRLKTRCIDLGQSYGDHVQRWSLQAPMNAWDDYRDEALTMIERINRHLGDEAEQVARLLVGVGRTRIG